MTKLLKAAAFVFLGAALFTGCPQLVNHNNDPENTKEENTKEENTKEDGVAVDNTLSLTEGTWTFEEHYTSLAGQVTIKATAEVTNEKITYKTATVEVSISQQSEDEEGETLSSEEADFSAFFDGIKTYVIGEELADALTFKNAEIKDNNTIVFTADITLEAISKIFEAKLKSDKIKSNSKKNNICCYRRNFSWR